MTNVREQQIMDEADRQRSHELKMAEIQAANHKATELRNAQRSESRNETVRWIVAITGVASIGITLILVIANGVSADREKEILIQDRQNRVAEQCIQAGNLWVDGDCLITKSS